MSFVILLAACRLGDPAEAARSWAFQGPRVVREFVRPIVDVASGDFDGDARPDLAEVDGTGGMVIFLAGPAGVEDWIVREFQAGKSSIFLRSADLDSDGDDDLLVADPGSFAFTLLSRGDGTFQPGQTLTEAPGTRWIAGGDWNGDRVMDIATAQFESGSVGIYLGRTGGGFRWVEAHLTPGRPHAIEGGDYEGDGRVDLLVKLSDVGVLPLRGLGDGRFEAGRLVANLGRDGNIAVEDFDRDGRSDLAIQCCGVGLSNGDGTFRKTWSFDGFDDLAVRDMDGDGRLDLVRLVAEDSASRVVVEMGRGDGTFLLPDSHRVIGRGISLHGLRDLDGDGALDLILSSSDRPNLLIVRGQRGPRRFEGAHPLPDFAGAGTLAAADLDRDGWPDLFVPSPTRPEVQVLLQPGRRGAPSRSITIDTPKAYTSLAVADLDGDGTPDLAGANRVAGTWLVSLLDARGTPLEQFEGPSGPLPSAVAAARLDGNAAPALAIACAGSGSIALVSDPALQAGRPAATVATVERPRDLAVGDVDGDGRQDLAVISSEALAIHFGMGPGSVSGPVVLARDPTLHYTDMAMGDLDGDGWKDIALGETRSGSSIVFLGRGNRRFAQAPPVPLCAFPVSVGLADLDGDGLPEVISACALAQSMAVVPNSRSMGLGPASLYWTGFSPSGHVASDLDLDGSLDLVPYRGSAALVIPGRPSGVVQGRFRRGDADREGRVAVNDPIAIIDRLFLGGPPLPCPDAADSNDDGRLDVSDPVTILNRLFLGGPALPPPGPEACGVDPTPDVLLECDADC